MRQSTNQIDDVVDDDIADKLTPEELKQLRLRFAMERWDVESERIRSDVTPSRTNKRDAARFKCPMTGRTPKPCANMVNA